MSYVIIRELASQSPSINGRRIQKIEFSIKIYWTYSNETKTSHMPKGSYCEQHPVRQRSPRESTPDKVLCSIFDSNYYTDIRTVSDISKTTSISISVKHPKTPYLMGLVTIIFQLIYSVLIIKAQLRQGVECQLWLAGVRRSSIILSGVSGNVYAGNNFWLFFLSIYKQKWMGMGLYKAIYEWHIIHKEEEIIFSTWSESKHYLICKYPTVS